MTRRRGFPAIMRQDLEPTSKKPAGPAKTVIEFPHPGRTPVISHLRGADSLWAIGDSLYFALTESTSRIVALREP
jgi:hypothetical protein